MPEIAESEYVIRIDFERGSREPSRVFTSMARLIQTFQEFDRHLARAIAADIEPVVILEDIEVGSLKSRLRTIVESVPDDVIQSGDWKKLLGHYLLLGKHRLLKFLEENPTVTQRHQLVKLERSLLSAAEESNIRRIPAYQPIPPAELVQDLSELSRAVGILHPSDRASLVFDHREMPVNRDFTIPEESFDELITHEVISGKSEMILRVKKPDYLGKSMWQFRHGGRVVDAKILDEGWLAKFQAREIEVGPGDSLRAFVETHVGYDRHGEVVLIHYEITEVLGVIRLVRGSGQDILQFPE